MSVGCEFDQIGAKISLGPKSVVKFVFLLITMVNTTSAALSKALTRSLACCFSFLVGSIAFTSHLTPKYVMVKEAARPIKVEINFATRSFRVTVFFASVKGSEGILSIPVDVRCDIMLLRLRSLPKDITLGLSS